jgi:hypothetical protein
MDLISHTTLYYYATILFHYQQRSKNPPRLAFNAAYLAYSVVYNTSQDSIYIIIEKQII